MQVHPGLDVGTVAETRSLLRFSELLTRIIPPATFSKKRIPNGNFLIAGPVSTRKAPFEDFFIRSTLERSLRELVVIHAEKSRATRIEVGRILDTGKIFRRQFAGSSQPDFVEHSSKINEAFGFNVIGTRSFRLILKERFCSCGKVSTVHLKRNGQTTFDG
jgi:hypothetical protein